MTDDDFLLSAADYDLPLMLLREEALENNLRVFADFCAVSGVSHAPHAKTHMSRELIERQSTAGVWGFTAATPAQVKQLAEWGVERILHANVLVDRSAIAWVASRLLVPGAPEYFCYVDGAAGLELLLDELARHAPELPLPVLVELGFPGGRTGVRDDAEALELAARIAASPLLRLAGVAAFEGLMPADGAGADGVPSGADDYLRRVHALTERVIAEGLIDGVPIVTAGGSSYPDVVARALGRGAWSTPVRTVLRSGCYISHDHGVYQRTSPFDAGRGWPGGQRLLPAFELRASILSVPEDGLAIAGFGRREAPTDDRLPVVLGVAGGDVSTDGWEVVGVNDHHAFLRLPAGARPAPGTVLRLGISHPCGAFDRWREIPVITENDEVVDVVRPAL